MTTIELMDWERARPLAAPIRFEVFVREQKVPAEIELDAQDSVCLHAVGFVGKDAVATGRLLPDGHIGRMAVLKAWRGEGVGRAMLVFLLGLARQKGFDAVHLHAQTHALGFYARHGFTVIGDEFMEAGIPHRAMALQLKTVPRG